MTEEEELKKNETLKEVRHTANNQLAVILGYSQLLKTKISKGTKESEWLQKILEECEKLQDTIIKIR